LPPWSGSKEALVAFLLISTVLALRSLLWAARG